MSNTKKTTAGFVIANPKIPKSNLVTLSKCEPCGETVTCEYSKTLVNGNVVAGIEYNGMTLNFPSPITITPAIISGADTSFIDAINALIATYELDTIVETTNVGGVFTLFYYGKLNLVALIIDGERMETFKNCATHIVCDYKLNIVGAVTAFSYNGNTNAPANSPYLYAGDAVQDAATAAALATDVLNALTIFGLTSELINVEPNPEDNDYTVTIESAMDLSSFLADTRAFVLCPPCELRFKNVQVSGNKNIGNVLPSEVPTEFNDVLHGAKRTKK